MLSVALFSLYSKLFTPIQRLRQNGFPPWFGERVDRRIIVERYSGGPGGWCPWCMMVHAISTITGWDKCPSIRGLPGGPAAHVV